jgi:hypothetical protein
MFREITGREMPPSPIWASHYMKAGLSDEARGPEQRFQFARLG